MKKKTKPETIISQLQMPCELNIVGFKQHTGGHQWAGLCRNLQKLWFCWWVIWLYNNAVKCLKACWKQDDGVQIHTEFLFTSVYCSVFHQYTSLGTSPQIFLWFSFVFNWNSTWNIYLHEAANLHWCSVFISFPGHINFLVTVCNCLNWFFSPFFILPLALDTY